MKNIIICLHLFCLSLFSFDLNYNSGAVENIIKLKQIKSMELKLNDNNPVTGLDYDEKTKTFLLSTLKFQLYTMNESLSKIKTYLKSTPDWIIQMEDTVSASFYNGSQGIMSYNKTYEFFKYNQSLDEASKNQAWRYLYDGYDNFTLDFKDRYYTIRAKQQYILSWDHSKYYNEFFVATVPDDIQNTWSIASFSDTDNMLSTEFIPSFDDEKLKIKKDRNVNDYYITGLDAHDESIYLLSKQYSSILELNPQTRKIIKVYGFKGLSDPRALAIKDNNFYIASRENSKNMIFVFEIEQ